MLLNGKPHYLICLLCNILNPEVFASRESPLLCTQHVDGGNGHVWGQQSYLGVSLIDRRLYFMTIGKFKLGVPVGDLRC